MKRFRVVHWDCETNRGWNSGEGAETLPEALDLLDALIAEVHDFTRKYPGESWFQVVDTEPEPPKILLSLELERSIYWGLGYDRNQRCGSTERPWREVLK